jgi:lysM domain protein
MAFPVRRTDYRRSGENIMRTFLIAFTTIVLLAGYAVQPLEKTVPYKVTLRTGESVWDACAKVASSKDDVREVVYNALKENHIGNPGSVQPGTELVIRVKEMK